MSDIDRTVLTAIANATSANADFYVSQAEGLPLVQHNPPLITVDAAVRDPSDNTKVAARITEAGVAFLGSQNATKPVSAYSVSTVAIEIPKPKRGGGGGGGGAPTKYPFDTMDVGTHFFVADTDAKKGDAVKQIGSAVGAANQRYSVETGETHSVTRAKRDNKNKAVLDAAGAKVMETVTLPIKNATKKFVVRRVEAGVKYGEYVAEGNGAVVIRTL